MKGKSLVMAAAFAATSISIPFSSFAADSSLSLGQRVRHLEQLNQTRNQLQADLAFQVTQLQKEVRELHGLVEEHDFKLNQIQERQRDLYREIESRFAAGTSTAGNATPPAGNQNSALAEGATQPKGAGTASKGVQTATAEAGPRGEFEAAFELVRKRKYNQAVEGFRAFLTRYPQSSYSDNARFWIGQVYFAQSKLDDAVLQFKQLQTDFPQSSKIPSAMLKVADIYVKQQKWSEAKSIYNDIVARYTGAQQQLARKGLQKIKSAGH